MTRKPRERDRARERLLKAALPHVAFDGWTWTAIEAGAADAKLSAEDAQRLLPGGPAELLRLFSDWADGEMARRMATAPEELKLSGRIRMAVRARIEAMAPYREAARRGAAFLALPPNAALGLACLYRTVDAMWRAAGDRSADFSFYTKRATLAGVYGATLLYWFDDRSEDFAATWEFLDRRLEDTMRIGELRGRCARLAEGLPNPFRLARAFRPR